MKKQDRGVIGLFMGVLILAGIAVAITNGGNTVAIIKAGTSGFLNILKAALGQK